MCLNNDRDCSDVLRFQAAAGVQPSIVSVISLAAMLLHARPWNQSLNIWKLEELKVYAQLFFEPNTNGMSVIVWNLCCLRNLWVTLAKLVTCADSDSGAWPASTASGVCSCSPVHSLAMLLCSLLFLGSFRAPRLPLTQGVLDYFLIVSCGRLRLVLAAHCNRTAQTLSLYL